MKKTEVTLPEIKLVGILVRTKTQEEFDPKTAKIGPSVQRYHQANLKSKISHPKHPGITFCAYTEYESDYTGYYSFFIGEEVTSFEDIPEGFVKLLIPTQRYAKFTAGPSSMPQVVIEAWQEIWSMTPQDFGGTRRYHTDFELYDARSKDPQNAIVDLFVGIKPS